MSPKVSEKHLRRRRVPHLVCLTFRSIAGDQARVVLAHRAHAATNHSWLTSESVKCRRVGIELMQPRPRPEPTDEPDQTMLREALSSPRTLHGRDVRLVTVWQASEPPTPRPATTADQSHRDVGAARGCLRPAPLEVDPVANPLVGKPGSASRRHTAPAPATSMVLSHEQARVERVKRFSVGAVECERGPTDRGCRCHRASLAPIESGRARSPAVRDTPRAPWVGQAGQGRRGFAM